MPHPRQTRRLAPALALIPTLALPAAGARPALAHAELRDAEPADGAVLQAAPARIVLAFTEPMRVTSLRLLDAAGRERTLRREDGAARTEATSEVRAAVPTPLPPGAYRVEYRGLSADGHVGGGTLRFRVDGAAAPR